MGTLKAILFDLDGTLTHTDPIHLRAFQHLLAEDGMTLDDQGFREHVSGRANGEIGARLFSHRHEDDHGHLLRQKEALFRELAVELRPIAGVLDFIDAALSKPYRIALVTNAPRENVEHILAAIGATGRFETIICGDELARSKPDPLPYITALKVLEVDAAEAVAFEDSLSGVHAAVAARIRTIGVATTLKEADLLAAGADLAVHDYLDDRLTEQIM